MCRHINNLPTKSFITAVVIRSSQDNLPARVLCAHFKLGILNLTIPIESTPMIDTVDKVRLTIETSYRQRTPKSYELSKQAQKYLPSGVVHDSRYIKPYGLYSSHAKESKKWDVDGNEYIDYFGGHGALMLGHNHPQVSEAIKKQLIRGTHFATNHELEILWAQKICEMVPSAEKVRFHSSGTEATQMAVRLARAFTGRNKLIRCHGHYHGWLDDMTSGYATHFDGSAVIGVPKSTAENSIAIDP